MYRVVTETGRMLYKDFSDVYSSDAYVGSFLRCVGSTQFRAPDGKIRKRRPSLFIVNMKLWK